MALSEHRKINSDQEMRYMMELEERARLDQIFLRNASIKEGLKEGQNKAKIEIAKNLFKMGLPLEKIAEATGLTTQELEPLVKA